MKTTTFLNNVVNEAFVPFEYYRHGPVAMHKLKPGFIFQACVDTALDAREIVSVEAGLGDHCLPDLGMALQLKTTTGAYSSSKNDAFVFCRAEGFGDNFIEERCEDVENRILDMYGRTGTSRFILSHVNLTTKEIEHYLLHDGHKTVGTWNNPSNVGGTRRQSHFIVRFSNMVRLK